MKQEEKTQYTIWKSQKINLIYTLYQVKHIKLIKNLSDHNIIQWIFKPKNNQQEI